MGDGTGLGFAWRGNGVIVMDFYGMAWDGTGRELLYLRHGLVLGWNEMESHGGGTV